jgi:hypothetical protein
MIKMKNHLKFCIMHAPKLLTVVTLYFKKLQRVVHQILLQLDVLVKLQSQRVSLSLYFYFYFYFFSSIRIYSFCKLALHYMTTPRDKQFLRILNTNLRAPWVRDFFLDYILLFFTIFKIVNIKKNYFLKLCLDDLKNLKQNWKKLDKTWV